jgi:DNA polymerase (family 10)
MTNTEIAKIFQDIAELLKLKKDNIFKIRAYEKVARSINELPVEVEQMVREGRLKEIQGVGEAIAKKITEMVNTGHLQFYERLKAEVAEAKNERTQ